MLVIFRPCDAVDAVSVDEQAHLNECIQDSLDQMQRALPDHHILSADQYSTADNDLSTESELSIEEAVNIVLTPDPEETSDVDEPSIQLCTPAPSPVASTTSIIDKLHDLQDDCMSRNDFQNIANQLGYLILEVERKAQHAKTTQTSILNFFRQ